MKLFKVNGFVKTDETLVSDDIAKSLVVKGVVQVDVEVTDYQEQMRCDQQQGGK